MLVLSRKRGEQITIGDDITITVVEIGPGRVRLGIDAPDEVAVHRKEVLVELRLADRQQIASRGAFEPQPVDRRAA